jgi:hypothetical protein
MSHVRRTRRLLAVLLGVLLLAVSAEYLISAVGAARLDQAHPEIFPPAPRPDFDLVDQGAADLQRVEVSVDVASTDTQVDITLELPADSPFTVGVAEGEFAEAPEDLVWNLAGNPVVTVAEQAVGLRWSPPVVTRGTDETALVELHGRPAAAGRGYHWGGSVEVALTRSAWMCGPACVVELELRAEPTHTLSEVVVAGTVGAQGPQHVSARLSAEGTAQVTLAPTDPSSDAAAGVVPEPVRALLATVANYLWPLVPWAVLYAVLRRLRPAGGDAQTDPEAQRAGARLGDRFYLLLALGMVALADVGVSLVTGVILLVEERSGDSSTIDGSGVEGLSLAFYPGVLEAAYAMWVVAALSRGGRPGPRVVASSAALGLAAVAALVLVLTADPTTPGGGVDEAAWVREDLAVGIATGALACAVFCWGVARRWAEALVPALAGLSVLVVVSVLAATWSQPAQVAVSVASALATAAMLLVLARIALGDLIRISSRSRGSRRVARALAVVALLLIVLPALPVLQQGRADAYLAGNATFALRSLVPLALIISAVIVLRSRSVTSAGTQPLPWAVVLLLSASLVLRPEVLYAGIPWSFGVGLLLVVLVLFPRSGSWGSDWLPTQQQSSPAVIGATLRRSTRAATYHHLQEALRKKVATAEVDAKDADATRKVVAQAFGELPRRPGPSSMRDAFNWAGEANPWRRAVTATVAATVVGLVLQIGTLADTIAQISGPFGSRPWGTVAAAALAFRFPLYGFVFGYFFPLIPGATGLVKSLRLFVVLAGSESVLLLVPFTDTGTVEAVTIRILQMAVICLVLGVGADYLALRQGGSGAEGLRDIYHTSRFVLWGSGVAVAAATALATALAGSAMTLLVERIVPTPPDQQVSTSPSDQQDPASGDGGTGR